MIKTKLEETHEFKCDCKLCARDIGSHFESAERMITHIIKALPNHAYDKQYDGIKYILKKGWENLDNKKSYSFNGYTLDSFIGTHLLETIAFQCSYPFFHK